MAVSETGKIMGVTLNSIMYKDELIGEYDDKDSFQIKSLMTSRFF